MYATVCIYSFQNDTSLLPIELRSISTALPSCVPESKMVLNNCTQFVLIVLPTFRICTASPGLPQWKEIWGGWRNDSCIAFPNWVLKSEMISSNCTRFVVTVPLIFRICTISCGLPQCVLACGVAPPALLEASFLIKLSNIDFFHSRNSIRILCTSEWRLQNNIFYYLNFDFILKHRHLNDTELTANINYEIIFIPYTLHNKEEKLCTFLFVYNET